MNRKINFVLRILYRFFYFPIPYRIFFNFLIEQTIYNVTSHINKPPTSFVYNNDVENKGEESRKSTSLLNE